MAEGIEFSVSYKKPQSMMNKKMLNLFRKQEMTDLGLTSNGSDIIQVHRVMVAMESTVLRDFLSQKFVPDNYVLMISDIDQKTLSNLVNWIYGDKITLNGWLDVKRFIEGGETLKITGFEEGKGPTVNVSSYNNMQGNNTSDSSAQSQGHSSTSDDQPRPQKTLAFEALYESIRKIADQFATIDSNNAEAQNGDVQTFEANTQTKEAQLVNGASDVDAGETYE